MELKLATNGDLEGTIYDLINNDEKALDHKKFLRSSTIVSLKNYFKDEHSIKDLFEDINELRSVWKLLLVDAIFYLRINDRREVHFRANKENGEKSDMESDGVGPVADSNVYGIHKLLSYFEQFTKFESILYGAEHYYRDHIIHPINVWIIGLNILVEYGEKFKIRTFSGAYVSKEEHGPEIEISEELPYPKCYSISLAELTAMWTIIALTHDLGYPLEKVEKINDQLEQMLSHFGKISFSRSRFNFETQHDHLIRFLLDLISSKAKSLEKDENCEPTDTAKGPWVTYKRTKYYTKFSKSWEMFDHGIVSSLLLLKSLTYFIETDYCSKNGEEFLNFEDARQFSIRSEILHTIASHTTAKIYHLLPNNLPFLLILCDELQEWGRPTLSDFKVGKQSKINEITIKKFEYENDFWNLHFELKYDKKDDFYDQVLKVYPLYKKWAERLRPGPDDGNRKLKFNWEIFFGNNASWEFIFDSSVENHFKLINIKGPEKTKPRQKCPNSYTFQQLEAFLDEKKEEASET